MIHVQDSPNCERIAELLVVARRSGRRLTPLPAGLALAVEGDAWAVQGEVARLMEARIGGWKVAMPAGSRPMAAPMMSVDIHRSPARIPLPAGPECGVEAEVAFQVGRDLPGRPDGGAYSREEVADAIEGAFAAIEIVAGRFLPTAEVPQLDMLADNLGNAGFVAGPLCEGWRDLALAALPVRLEIDGRILAARMGGNPVGDPFTPVVWLANHLARRGDGLGRGQMVTTGSFTGLNFAEAGQRVVAQFAGLGDVSVEFAA